MPPVIDTTLSDPSATDISVPDVRRFSTSKTCGWIRVIVAIRRTYCPACAEKRLKG